MRRSFVAGCAIAASALLSSPVLGNGGDFFEELAASWGAANADEGVPYFGFVKDNKGKGIAGASVAATTATGSTFVVQADTQGHYRIPGFSKSVDAKLVQINCSKTGYKLFARDRRVIRSKANVPIETNCVLTPSPGKPIS
jgi:hypothetical protein